MSESDYDYTEPWEMYSDEEKPWQDLDRLLALEEQMDNQYEMGDALGCTPATISYWLQKARDSQETTPDGNDIECNNCGGDTPARNEICDDCLDDLRAADREAAA